MGLPAIAMCRPWQRLSLMGAPVFNCAAHRRWVRLFRRPVTRDQTTKTAAEYFGPDHRLLGHGNRSAEIVEHSRVCRGVYNHVARCETLDQAFDSAAGFLSAKPVLPYCALCGGID